LSTAETARERAVAGSHPRRHIEYDGSDLESEITRVLHEFKPDWVVMPDPRDRHPDHCTTGVFVLDALRKLRGGGAPDRRMLVLTYLVHAPDYPGAARWAKEIETAGVGGSPTAQRVLANVRWRSLALSGAQQAGKRAALGQYASQIQVMRPFLNQFVRSFEIFGQLDATQVEIVPADYALRFGRSR